MYFSGYVTALQQLKPKLSFNNFKNSERGCSTSSDRLTPLLGGF
jgi:hypothetical protein